MTADAAAKGIREHDTEGAIVLVGDEPHAPYKRPPLSKGLWFGKETREQLPVHDEAWYRERRIEQWDGKRH